MHAAGLKDSWTVAEQTTRSLVCDLYAAYARRDLGRVVALLHDDIDWIIYAPITLFPFAGPRRGRAEVLEVLTGIAEQYQVERYEPETVIVENERAAVMSDVSFVQRSSQRVLRFKIVDFLRFRDDRIVEFREFTNTFDVAEQALGRFLAVQA
jgi:ketosteroid isomerase-like protein